ncbi:MAG: hypothetical protein WBR21_11930 [Rouxiella badensis]|uniref:hypothetical protein n=1 Tax=Rouxiella badensis TaxID=1646377 RepID=UPI003C37EF15
MISQATVSELTQPEPSLLKRSLNYGKTVSQFATIQVIVQAIGFWSGILLVHLLSTREYAYFTIANTMQGTLNVLADIGISVGVVSIGGKVWQDRDRFGQLINTALQLRRWLGAASILVVTPVLYFMLVRNGAPPIYSSLLILLLLLGLGLQLSIGVLSAVPRLYSNIRLIQGLDFVGMIARLALILGLSLVFLNAGIALCIGSVTLLLQYWILHRYVRKAINLRAPVSEEDRGAMLGFIRKLAANAAFYCFQ